MRDLSVGMVFAKFVGFMMKNALKYLVIVSLLLSLVSCHEDEPAPPVKEAHRTVLVYMVADNSLGGQGDDDSDIDEMIQAAAAGDIGDGRLLVYHNRPGTNNGNAPELLEITPTGTVVLKTYPDDPQKYSVDVDRMKEVFADVKRLSPADDYGLVLWSHGMGWVENGASRAPVLRSFGDDRGVTMKVSSLARALDGEGFGFVYFDCCYMASVEVAYELRNVTPLIIASATELPAAGMPYHRNVKVFFSEPLDVVRAARNTFELYDGQVAYMRTCTMSVIDTSVLDELATVVGQIMESGAMPTVSRDRQQRFMVSSDCRFYDLGRYIETLDCDPLLVDRFNDVMGRVVVYKAATPYIWGRLKIEHHSGLSVYPVYELNDASRDGYSNQAWWRDVVSRNPNIK